MNGKGIGDQLDELGFDLGSVSEVILTTVNPECSLTAAPMGALRKGPDILEIKPFKTSSTYRNLLGHGRACINVTSDPALFLMTAFKEEGFKGFPKPSFSRGMRLDSSDAHVFIEAMESRDISEDRAEFTCKITDVEIVKTTPWVFSRGRAEAIEAVVHATRIEVFAREGRWERVESLIRRFSECKDVVGRVSAPDSKEAGVIRELERLIAGWRERERR